MLRLSLPLIILALALPTTVAAARDGTASAADTGVTASGTGFAEAAPDVAMLRFGITARQPTVAGARDEVAVGVARLIELARGFGLEDEHIATAALSVRPDTYWNPDTRTQEHRGFVVSREIGLRLGDISQLGELTERALALGVTDASPAVFDTTRRKTLEAEALAAAALDARARAAAAAEALGVQVGRPLRIETGGGFTPPQPMLRAAAMAEADAGGGAETYQPGLIRITATVTVTFALAGR